MLKNMQYYYYTIIIVALPKKKIKTMQSLCKFIMQKKNINSKRAYYRKIHKLVTA